MIKFNSNGLLNGYCAIVFFMNPLLIEFVLKGEKVIHN